MLFPFSGTLQKKEEMKVYYESCSHSIRYLSSKTSSSCNRQMHDHEDLFLCFLDYIFLLIFVSLSTVHEVMSYRSARAFVYENIISMSKFRFLEKIIKVHI